jgi:ankyrin repeat protein
LTTSGCTPFLIAVQKGHLTVVTKLVAAGALVDKARTTDGCTPLCIAASFEQLEKFCVWRIEKNPPSLALGPRQAHHWTQLNSEQQQLIATRFLMDH